jgi:YHS domain-containing protein
MNFWETITCWYNTREKGIALSRSNSIESLNEKYPDKENKIKNDICCGNCCCCLETSNKKKIKQALIKDKCFYFCTEECYLEWLKTPVNMWLGFNFSTASDQ